MQVRPYQTIDAETLRQHMQNERPDNEHEDQGYALVNVLGKDSFEAEHIPGSINIPKSQPAEFEDRFAKDKEIILYCASTDCDASPTVAEELAGRGFTRIRDFEAGVAGWKRIDGPLEGSAVS